MITTAVLASALLAAIPTPPTASEARQATRIAVRDVASVFDGHASVAHHCPANGRVRVCRARITGPVPMRLRVRVWRHGAGYLVSARPVAS